MCARNAEDISESVRNAGSKWSQIKEVLKSGSQELTTVIHWTIRIIRRKLRIWEKKHTLMRQFSSEKPPSEESVQWSEPWIPDFSWLPWDMWWEKRSPAHLKKQQNRDFRSFCSVAPAVPECRKESYHWCRWQKPPQPLNVTLRQGFSTHLCWQTRLPVALQQALPCLEILSLQSQAHWSDLPARESLNRL